MSVKTETTERLRLREGGRAIGNIDEIVRRWWSDSDVEDVAPTERMAVELLRALLAALEGEQSGMTLATASEKGTEAIEFVAPEPWVDLNECRYRFPQGECETAARLLRSIGEAP